MSTIGPKNPSLPRLDKANVAKGASRAEGPAATKELAKDGSRSVAMKFDTFERAQSSRVGDLLGGKEGVTPEAPLEGGGSLRLEGPLGGAEAESPLDLKILDGGPVQAGPASKEREKSTVRDLFQGAGKLRLEDFDLETLEKYRPTITREDYEARRQELLAGKAGEPRGDKAGDKAHVRDLLTKAAGKHRLEDFDLETLEKYRPTITREDYEARRQELQKAAIEQKDAIEQKARLEQKEATEWKMALEQKEALERKVAIDRKVALEQKAALEQKVALEQKDALER